MISSFQSLGIDRLNLADRLELVRDLWDSIAAEVEAAPLSESQRQEIDRRWLEHENNPDAAIPWEPVKAEALARLQR